MNADPRSPTDAQQQPPGAPELPQLPAGALDIDELARFLQAFNEQTARLRESHDSLRTRVEELSGELRQKNDELSSRVEEISALKNYLANILESTADGVLTLNQNGELVALNRTAADLLPPEPASAERNESAERLEDLTGAARAIGVDEALGSECAVLARILEATMQEGEATTHTEVCLKDAGGAERIFAVSAGPILSEAGEIAGAVATCRDNTEIRHLESVLRRRERLAALGEMAAQLAHEIRNPLGGIDLYASLLRRSLEDRAEERQLAEKIAAATKSLNRLVEDMLTFTRPSEPRTLPVAADQLLEGALDLAGGAPEQVEVVRDYDADLPRAKLDPDLMQRALLNVLLNALQVMPGGGTLHLATGTGSASGRVAFSVEDTGPGVEEGIREKIFNPFFTTRDGGTGLGLAIVQKITQEHGGAVSVEAGGAGGARFVFDVPAAD
jgi:nitrogen-specific signal transduction histidine kinase